MLTLIDRFAAIVDSLPSTPEVPSAFYAQGINVSKAEVEAAEKAGKAKFTADEIPASAEFIASIVPSSASTASGLSGSASNLTKAGMSTSSYWQSAGPTGSHTLTIELQPGVTAGTIGLVVDPGDDSYCPAELTVSVAENAQALSKSPVHIVPHNFAVGRPQGFLFALLGNEDPKIRFVRIGIKKCVSGGQDCRVRGIIVRPLAAPLKMVPASTAGTGATSFFSTEIFSGKAVLSCQM